MVAPGGTRSQQSSHHNKNNPYKKPSGASSGSTSSGPAVSTSSTVQCTDCGWVFDDHSFLHLHKVLMHSRRKATKTMTRPEEYRCEQCQGGQTFKQFEQFTEHLRCVHNDGRHVCKFCTKMFKLKGSLLVHQR